MPADIMPAPPRPAARLARRSGEHIALIHGGQARLGLLSERVLALAAGEAEAAVDDGRAEEPLRDKHPPRRDQRPADSRASPSPTAGQRGVGQDEGEEGGRDPRPPALDEEHVDQVVLARKVRRRQPRVLRVRLPRRVVRRRPRLGRHQREDGPEHQQPRVRR
ncbi:hypothetical protein MFIFM68171_10200 [Madurella fahalii]|uniref:Uncharacterized protein n=1 Tax=Madurella fahalii TaxID=1157608 RepID=A0ABQ0GQJ2_9PEZI